jgi:hypothetical protein
MDPYKSYTHPNIDPTALYQLKSDLADLDREWVDIDGAKLRPSQCYYLGADPLHILYNTNCPDELKQRVQSILSKYIPDESGAQ